MVAVYPLIICAIGSFVLGETLVLTSSQHGRFTMDLPGAPQKVHLVPTPRIGGLAIYLAVLWASFLVSDSSVTPLLRTILIAGLPALVAGLLEDVTRRVSVRARLAATVCSGAAACWLSGLSIARLDVPGFDYLLAFAPLAIAFTAFAVGGVANSINIIDGFNGLASGTSAIALSAIAYIAWQCGDAALVTCSLILIAAIGGFWALNFPWGKLFLGDGGAYFAGFALAWLAILLPARNPGVSPWASLLVCAYPVTEVLYSVARRLRSRRSPGMPDCSHLHSLVALHVIQRRLTSLDPRLQNSAVSVLMWFCAAIPALLGVTLYRHTPWLVLAAACCVLLYHWLYRQVARA